MDTKELLKKVRKIEIKTKRLSDHIFGGEYQSTFKGRGMAFSEVRQYQFGDDVRAIDWNVTARYNDTFIKVFEEERELTMMLIIDISGSNFFGSDSLFKNEYVMPSKSTVQYFVKDAKLSSWLKKDISSIVGQNPMSQKTDMVEGIISIMYKDYKINEGIDKNIFKD